jgi:hypothetical protein
MEVTRNFECEYLGEPCRNRLCRKGHCVPAQQEREASARRASASGDDLRDEAKIVARDWLRWIKGVSRPDDEQILRVAKLPRAMEEAARRIKERQDHLPN